MRVAGPELARRWVAALLLVPESNRAEVVRAVEERIGREFPGLSGPHAGVSLPDEQTPLAAPDQRDREFVVVYPSQQRQGHVEQVQHTYASVEPKLAKPAKSKRKRA